MHAPLAFGKYANDWEYHTTSSTFRYIEAAIGIQIFGLATEGLSRACHVHKNPNESILRNSLREQTQPLHRKLDALVGELRPFSCSQRYGVYLQAMRDLYFAFEGRLDQFSLLVGLPQHSSSIIACIQTDLERLGIASDEFVANVLDGSRDAKADAADPETQLAEAHGVGYTLEGSALGAKFLLGFAQEGLPTGTPMAFLQELKGHASSRWPTVVKALSESDCEVSVAVEAATSVFTEAIAGFSRRLESFAD